MGSDFRIRQLTEQDLPAAMALKEAAGWNQTEQDWRLLLRLEPEGCFALEADGRVVASATAFRYEQQLAWIGMVLTLPEYRGRGFGNRVFLRSLEYCGATGVRCVGLDATDLGQPLYERAGFAAEYNVERWGGVPRPVHARNGGAGGQVRALAAADLDRLHSADTRAFGAARGPLLHALLEQSCDWAAVLERDGAPVAYAMSRPGSKAHYFGPCVAGHPADAALLFDAFAEAHPDAAVCVDVPAPNEGARALLAGRGLEVRRTLARMYYGANEARGEPGQVFGLAGFEYG